ncbi:MAG: ferritin family protein [Gammaproteobacteria bacterium]|nr:ferritin family protein [Gammaproteobacteria bacterium]
MAKIFYLNEIVKFAIERELESQEFYHKLAALADTQKARDLFNMLEQEEKKHELFYEHMLAAVPLEQTPGVEEDNEYLEYMQELIRSERTIEPLTTEEMRNMKVAIDYAIARERDSILFYNGLKNLLATEERSKIEPIILEEGKHIAKLTKLRHVL